MLWKVVDVGIIDGAVNGTGYVVRGSSALLRLFQTGSIRTYAASLFLGRGAGAGLLPDAVMMTDTFPAVRMLSLTVFLPLAGALALLLVPNRDGSRDGLVRWAALAVSLRHVRGDAGALGRLRRRRAPTSSSSSALAWIPAFGIDYYSASTASACCCSSSPGS